MIRATGRRRLTCYHEAGHALVRWYFGHMTDRAVVLTVEQVRAGVRIENRRGQQVACEGLVDGYAICDARAPLKMSDAPEWQAELDRRHTVARDVELINGYAGIWAEAAYTRKSVDQCVLGGGLGDLQESGRLLDAWDLDEDARCATLRAAERRAAALVRSRPGSVAIKAMADALMDQGEISGDEIASLCRAAYGGRECSFGAWDEHWPPTLAQIRAGCIPEDRQQAA